MHWEWSYFWLSLGIIAGLVMLGSVLDCVAVLRDIRDSLRNIEELLEPKRDYEVEAGLPIEDETED
jgi:hypothetical protein